MSKSGWVTQTVFVNKENAVESARITRKNYGQRARVIKRRDGWAVQIWSNY